MKLIVGLGNPDSKYLNTYHNLGFMAADCVAEELDADFDKTKCKAKIAVALLGGEKIIIAKPLTYMNLSGDSVSELMNYFKISLSDLLVIYDDYDLPKAFVRIRKNGSAGTHNGMKDIVAKLGSTDFARIRIGFNNGKDDIALIDFVLSKINDADKPLFDEAVKNAGNAAVLFAKERCLDEIMQQFNSKHE